MTLAESIGINDRDLIEAVVGNFFIVDYGFIKQVNSDKTINVTHAKRPVTTDGTTLAPLETTNVEVLTLSGKGFSLNFDYAAGDKVLLLGLKNYIKEVDDVTTATETSVYMHYSRETLKALPLCVFNSDAKVKIEIESGTLKATATKIELNGNDNNFVTWTELNTALQTLWTAVQTHTHPYAATVSAGVTSPSETLAAQTMDISAAKTKTIFTGG